MLHITTQQNRTEQNTVKKRTDAFIHVSYIHMWEFLSQVAIAKNTLCVRIYDDSYAIIRQLQFQIYALYNVNLHNIIRVFLYKFDSRISLYVNSR